MAHFLHLAKITKITDLRYLTRLMGARSTSDTFELLVEGSLPDSRKKNPVDSLTFTFHEREVGYVQFQVLSFWGKGGGLQFLELLPGRKKKLGKKNT